MPPGRFLQKTAERPRRTEWRSTSRKNPPQLGDGIFDVFGCGPAAEAQADRVFAPVSLFACMMVIGAVCGVIARRMPQRLRGHGTAKSRPYGRERKQT
jgi:hypothetical protein